MAGGTGGHVFPGLSLAEELISRNFRVEWLGTSKGIEASLVPQAELKLHTINIAGVRGRGLVPLLTAPFKVLGAIFSALKVIRKVKPSLVVGFGGYASGPGGLAAKIKGLPLIIHEQNAIAGTTNKSLARFANKVAENNGSRANILILGGSRGAKAINEIIPEILKTIDTNAIDVLHQCGKGHRLATESAYRDSSLFVNVVEFIDDMKEAFQWADLVIGRSGASTVTELAEVGLPAIFIPFPYAIDDHQTANAEYLVKAGAAQVFQQAELKNRTVAASIRRLIENRHLLETMGKKAKAMAKPDAAKDLADMCEELMRG